MKKGALITVLAGAVGSLAFMLRVGRHNPSLILLILFAVWVLSPFMAMIFAIRRVRMMLYVLTLVLSLGSLAVYGYVALGPPIAKPAFFFLVVPLASWVVIAMSLFIGRQRGRPG